MNHDNYMLPFEVEYSVKLGNAIARKINPRPNANAAIRHRLALKGRAKAERLARQLLGLSDADASALVERLANTKPNDIVSPHFE